MNHDLKKTLIFAGVALAAIVIAWEPWKLSIASSDANQEAKVLFPKLTDAKQARALEVIQYDEDTSSIKPFSIEQSDGVWRIPSHSKYPADAAENLAKAATSLMDLKILNLASTNPGDQKLYGVIEPDINKLQAGAVGVGTRVTLKGEGDKKVADLIVGKEVKDKPEQRYVRKPGKDQIYVVAIKTDKFSTKFGDWIEKDLLKLNTFDIKNLQLNDYSVQLGQGEDGNIGLAKDDRSRIRLAYDDATSKWNIDELIEFNEKGEPVESKLGENEELNTEKLNALKTALDDLQIVDVEKKPAGLSQDLRASEDFIKNQQTVNSLAARGFIPVRMQDGIEILSTEGEVYAGMKDGVEYVLRFGQVAGADEGAAAEAEKPAADKPDEAKGAKVNRYLFVTARFNQDLIAQPKLDPLPGEAAGDEAAGSEAAADKAEEAAADEGAAGAAKPAEEKPAAAKKPVPEKKTAQKEGEAKAGAAAAKTEPTGDKPADPAKPEGDTTKPAGDAEAQGDAAKSETTQPDPKAQAAEREKIEKENKRKQDEYDGNVKKGQERVAELNARFADWYYVISDDVYKKIHLGKTDIVKTKEKPAGQGDGLGDLNALEKGLKAPGAGEAPADLPGAPQP